MGYLAVYNNWINDNFFDENTSFIIDGVIFAPECVVITTVVFDDT